jgi:hypothetical protein
MMMNKLLLTGLLAMAALQGEAKDDGLNKSQFDKCWACGVGIARLQSVVHRWRHV